MEIKVSHKTIGGSRTFIIAEIGSNHCQDLKLAYETIDAAAEAGVDAVKFQSIRLDRLYYEPSQETISLHKLIDLPEEWHGLLNEYCKKKNLIFFSSPTYLEAVEILEEINVPLYKLASAQVGTFPQLVERVACTQKPVILSTGLVNFGELEKIIQIFRKVNNQKFVILHCTSVYPAPFKIAHMPKMAAYEKMFNCLTGFSDHTEGIIGSIVAVALGAKVIEKHFALSRDLPSPDAPLSLNPHELSQMVEGIRATEEMLKEVHELSIPPEALAFKERIRTRLVFNRDKTEGDILSSADFIFRRSQQGVDCSHLDAVTGQMLLRSKKAGELLLQEDVNLR